MERVKDKKSKPMLNELEAWGKRVGVKVKKMVESGSPSEKIIEIARREEVDLIVIGETKGFLRSYTYIRSIIKKACCPVLVIGEISRKMPCKTGV